MTATPNLLLLAVLAAVAALASGCATDLKIPEKVSINVPVPCIKPEDLPQRPALRTEDELMAMDRYQRTLALQSDWKKLQAYRAELEAIAAGCSKIPIQDSQGARP